MRLRSWLAGMALLGMAVVFLNVEPKPPSPFSQKEIICAGTFFLAMGLLAFAVAPEKETR